ncbi:TolC family protein [Acinetobacter shaoyimingii]|uniref:TolC family protein n=1 Tax=Acinetobacter shaoyimingii TaxID=2715164 RepID=A0A6G8RXK6_9GAMM|nr:TolC family protein [Acinetobacter shaoyimingii]QIO06601.1 TolC family protein [Acinetobacter shaoyimingii]
MNPVKKGYIVFPLVCMCLNTACVSLESKNLPKNKNLTSRNLQSADTMSAERAIRADNWAYTPGISESTNSQSETQSHTAKTSKTRKNTKTKKTSAAAKKIAKPQNDVNANASTGDASYINQAQLNSASAFKVVDDQSGQIITPRSVKDIPATSISISRAPVQSLASASSQNATKVAKTKAKAKKKSVTKLDDLNNTLKSKDNAKISSNVTRFANITGDEKSPQIQQEQVQTIAIPNSNTNLSSSLNAENQQPPKTTSTRVANRQLLEPTPKVRSDEPVVLATLDSVNGVQNKSPKTIQANKKKSKAKSNSPQPDPKLTVPDVILGEANPKLETRDQIGKVNCLSSGTLNSGNNLELMAAIERAICNNPDTKNAWIETKIRAAQEKMVQSQYYPQVSATADYIKGKSNTQYKNTDLLTYDSKIKKYGVAVQATWLLYDFGSRKQLLKESENLLAMSFAQQDYVLQTVMLQAIQAYYEVLKVEVQIDNAKQLESFAKKNYDIASARYNAGAGIRSDQLQMHANWVKAKSDLIKLNGDLKVAKGNLAAVMGNMAYQNFNVQSNSLKEIELIDLKPIQELLTAAGKTNPQLKQSQYAINAAQHKVKSVERTRYPTISFVSNFDNSTQDGEGSYAYTTQQMQTGLQLNFPIFDGFNRKNKVVEARQLLQQKYVEKEKIEQQIAQDVWKNYNLLQASIENINALKVLSSSAEQSYSVSQGRYKAGVGNILELINAQNLLTESKMKYSTALTEYLVIRFQLLSNVGTLNVW